MIPFILPNGEPPAGTKVFWRAQERHVSKLMSDGPTPYYDTHTEIHLMWHLVLKEKATSVGLLRQPGVSEAPNLTRAASNAVVWVSIVPPAKSNLWAFADKATAVQCLRVNRTAQYKLAEGKLRLAAKVLEALHGYEELPLAKPVKDVTCVPTALVDLTRASEVDFARAKKPEDWLRNKTLDGYNG